MRGTGGRLPLLMVTPADADFVVFTTEVAVTAKLPVA
jgi:hypothetical protein